MKTAYMGNIIPFPTAPMKQEMSLSEISNFRQATLRMICGPGWMRYILRKP